MVSTEPLSDTKNGKKLLVVRGFRQTTKYYKLLKPPQHDVQSYISRALGQCHESGEDSSANADQNPEKLGSNMD